MAFFGTHEEAFGLGTHFFKIIHFALLVGLLAVDYFFIL